MAWMQGNGDDGTAGGGRWLTRLTGGMRKRKREIETSCWGSCLPSLLMSPIYQINCLPISNQPTSLPHLRLSPRCASPLFSICCLLFQFLPSSSSSCALPSLILSLNGESCEQAMQMRWLLPHCSSSRAEETLIG